MPRGHGGGVKEKIVHRLIGEAITRGNGVVSYQVVQEFLNVALKKFATPFTVGQAQRFLSITFRPMFAVQSSLGLYSDALGIFSRYRTSWHDALIMAAASEAQCSVFIPKICTPEPRWAVCGSKTRSAPTEQPPLLSASHPFLGRPH